MIIRNLLTISRKLAAGRIGTSSIRILFCLAIYFTGLGLSSREVTFLPANVTGNPPEALRKKDNMPYGIAELTAYYMHENFMAEPSDFARVRSYLSELEEDPGRKPSRELLNGVCNEFDSDYIVKSEVDFENTAIILTQVYNCRGKVLASTESVLKENFYSSMEAHTKKALSFLVKKNRKEIALSSEEEEVIFLLDLSAAMSRDTSAAVRYIESILGAKQLAIGLVLAGDKTIKVIRPSFNHTAVKEALSMVKYGSDITLDRLNQALIKARNEIGQTDISKKKFIIITDAKYNSSGEYGYMSSVETIKNMDYKVSILTGSYFDYQGMGMHSRIAKTGGQPLQQIVHYQKIGTMNGYRILYLYDRTIYFDKSGNPNPADLNFAELNKLEEGKVFSLVDFPHPGNMAEVYSKIRNEKLIERGSVLSNIEQVLDKNVSGKANDPGFTGSKVLVKTESGSIWLTMKKNSEKLMDTNASFKVTFRKDYFSSAGYINIPEETQVYNENVPLLLVLNSNQIRGFLNSKTAFTCFIKGTVVDVK